MFFWGWPGISLICVGVCRNYAPGRLAFRLEFLIYLIFFIARFLDVGSVVKSVSDEYAMVMRDVRAEAYLSGLHDSWLTKLLGRKLDLKDAQWHGFRDNLFLLSVAAFFHLVASRLARRTVAPTEVRSMLVSRSVVNCITGVLLVAALHGADCLKVLVLALANFAISKHFGRVSIMWTFNICTLLTVEFYSGFRLPEWLGKQGWSGQIALWMDEHRGFMAWQNSFNLVTLRFLSFSIDRWWALSASQSKGSAQPSKDRESLVWKHGPSISMSLDETSRSSDFHPQWVYDSVIVYVGYVLYPPLYIAGPTLSFNNYVSHMVVPQQTYSSAGKIRYGLIRFAAILVLFEVLGHYFYVGAIAFMAFRFKVAGTPLLVAITRMSPAPVVLYSYVALIFLWFKFLLIWRFFRLWAVLDDVEPVENMERCINNNYTVGGFWRSWHRSFNRWLTRYLYIPLGGGKVSSVRKVVNIMIVFTFVGLWHDVKPELFAWAWLFSIFFIPELIAERSVHIPFVRHFLLAHPVYADLLRNVGGALSIVMLKVANIVGYSTGLDGARLLLPAIASSVGLLFLFEYFTTLVVSVSFMRFIERSTLTDSAPTSKSV